MGCHVLLQGIFLTQGLNPGLLHCGANSLSSEPRGKHRVHRCQKKTGSPSKGGKQVIWERPRVGVLKNRILTADEDVV